MHQAELLGKTGTSLFARTKHNWFRTKSKEG